MENVYKLAQAENPLPLVFDSPHSGRAYPEDFGYACDFGALQKAEDSYVDHLFERAPEYGAALLCALFPRTYIDPNRAADDIDPELLSDDSQDCHEIRPTPRSHAGNGLVRRLVKAGVPVYDRALPIAEISRRIENYYNPYHACLKALLDEAHYNFGQVWHINCHSMPQNYGAGGGYERPVPVSFLHGQPDFVIGDRDGTSCALDFTHSIRDFLKGRGYRVAINNPYRGVELVRRYANPAAGRHSVQLEIGKSLYWDEEKHEPSKNFAALKADIDDLIGFCARYAQANLADMAAD